MLRRGDSRTALVGDSEFGKLHCICVRIRGLLSPSIAMVEVDGKVVAMKEEVYLVPATPQEVERVGEKEKE